MADNKFWIEDNSVICTEIDRGDGPESYTVAEFKDLLRSDGSVVMSASSLATRAIRTIRNAAQEGA